MIKVLRDPSLKKPKIEVLHNTEQEKDTMIDQTKVFGTMVPLVAIDGIAIDFSEVQTLRIENTFSTKLPTCEFSFLDSKGLFKNYYSTKAHYIQIIILPPFDNAYKKINLVFEISKFNVDSSTIAEISGTGIYKCNELYDSRFEFLGSDISTFELFNIISENTKLGMASNISESTINDKRFINIPHISYKDLMDSEISKSGANENVVLDYWIDYWDYLNINNVFKLFINNSGSKPELSKVWVASNNMAVSTVDNVEPVKVDMALSNHPALSGTDLFIKDHSIEQNITKLKNSGTSKVLSIYNNNTKEWVDHTIEVSNISNNQNNNSDSTNEFFVSPTKTTFEYTGELYENYDSYFSNRARETFLKKITKEIHYFTLTKPILGVLKGDTFEVHYFTNDSMNTDYQDADKDTRTYLKNEDNNPSNGNKPNNSNTTNINTENLTKNIEVSGIFKVLGSTIHFDNSDGFEFVIEALKIN